MSELDFHIDLNIEVMNLHQSDLDDAARQLRALADEHNDLVGVSISVEPLAGREHHYLYQTRIVAYLRPENIAVIEKSETAEDSLRDAVQQMEECIRSERTMRKEVWQQPDQRSHLDIRSLTPKEIYQTYVGDTISEETVSQGRERIAAQLMVKERLEQENAYFAADSILAYTAQQETV